MKITFNWYNANRWLPEPDWLFQAVRRIDFLMKTDPNGNWDKIKEWCRPMGQLCPGLFFNITDVELKTFEEKIDLKGESSEEIKLMLTWIDRGYIRVQFEVSGTRSLIYKISNSYFRSDAIQNHELQIPTQKRMK